MREYYLVVTPDVPYSNLKLEYVEGPMSKERAMEKAYNKNTYDRYEGGRYDVVVKINPGFEYIEE